MNQWEGYENGVSPVFMWHLSEAQVPHAGPCSFRGLSKVTWDELSEGGLKAFRC